MYSLPKKIILVSLLGAVLPIVYVYINVFFSSGIDHPIRLFAPAYAADPEAAGEQVHPTSPKLPTFNRRLDVYEFIIGIFLSGLGLVALVLAFLRWKTKDWLLISFGVFCFLYGARTNAFQFLFEASRRFWDYEQWFITYLVPIPAFLLLEQIFGRGWKSSIRRIWQISIA